MTEGKARATTVRGTQSFVYTLSECWRRPSLTALEVLWRWVYGIPALLLVWLCVSSMLMSLPLDWDGLKRMTLLDPMAAANTLGTAITSISPVLLLLARWLVPVLIAAWILISSVGRTVVLRRADGRLHRRIGTLMLLQTIRMAALVGSFWVWFWLLERAAGFAITSNIALGEQPNLVLYCALAIVMTLGLFVAWAVLSWALSVAPLLAMLDDLGVRESLRAAFRLGAMRGKLVEINLVMGIVKIALIVLAMVFSATPLPFESVTTPKFLAWWWAGVTMVYFVASDFFHVARLVAYLQLWRTYLGTEKRAVQA